MYEYCLIEIIIVLDGRRDGLTSSIYAKHSPNYMIYNHTILIH